jgi:hypothetical protein
MPISGSCPPNILPIILSLFREGKAALWNRTSKLYEEYVENTPPTYLDLPQVPIVRVLGEKGRRVK